MTLKKYVLENLKIANMNARCNIDATNAQVVEPLTKNPHCLYPNKVAFQVWVVIRFSYQASIFLAFFFTLTVNWQVQNIVNSLEFILVGNQDLENI